MPSPIIAVHLDLKGVQFRPAYGPRLLADLASQGVNAVLVEYEDVFPFPRESGIDIAYDRRATWTPRALSRFLACARSHRIEVIPLQQCLGHLEYVYRWDRYRAMALDRKYPSTVDVTNPRAVRFVSGMLDQVLAAHPDSRYVHLGMDEAHALVVHARKTGADVVALFLEHLDRLCAICARHGKTPIIWSDMLEDHFTPQTLRRIAPFRDRVVLCPWDYGSSGERIAVGRIAGWRVSRAWLDEPDHADAPAIGAGHTFIEDLPPAVRRAVGGNLKGRFFTPMFQADLWTRLGFRVLGASAIRCSTNLAVMAMYHKLTRNIHAWSRAIQRTGQLGQVGTSWARGTSWCPPGYSIDLQWPLIAELSASMGGRPRPFFKGIAPRTVRRIIQSLGRCRDDWRIEARLADEMARLAPRLRGTAGHRYEWESILLMARVMHLQRRAAYNIDEVDFFHANARPVDSEWRRRLDEQRQTLRDIAALRSQVRRHFSKRYRGDAFEEWVRDLFDLHATRIRACQRICLQKLATARRAYARRPGPT